MHPGIQGGSLRGGLSFLKSIDFASILDGTSKTLNLLNQAIPIYNQVKPIVSNFQVLKNIHSIMNEKEEPVEEKHTSPIFYI